MCPAFKYECLINGVNSNWINFKHNLETPLQNPFGSFTSALRNNAQSANTSNNNNGSLMKDEEREMLDENSNGLTKENSSSQIQTPMDTPTKTSSTGETRLREEYKTAVFLDRHCTKEALIVLFGAYRGVALLCLKREAGARTQSILCQYEFENPMIFKTVKVNIKNSMFAIRNKEKNVRVFDIGENCSKITLRHEMEVGNRFEISLSNLISKIYEKAAENKRYKDVCFSSVNNFGGDIVNYNDMLCVVEFNSLSDTLALYDLNTGRTHIAEGGEGGSIRLIVSNPLWNNAYIIISENATVLMYELNKAPNWVGFGCNFVFTDEVTEYVEREDEFDVVPDDNRKNRIFNLDDFPEGHIYYSPSGQTSILSKPKKELLTKIHIKNNTLSQPSRQTTVRV
eukprot:TRINITY_DN3439_c0_g1_i4.p1 TRINITY_DN3439_c0_g1~~TRINITY_DN3439_c0_g1_i4.p1  ORF type:complete len:398 (-),score=74.66 TRINITY_DN3439_c0_g1_i4:922-2115(-)